MSKIKFKNKLLLNKEVVANINNDDMENIKGGDDQLMISSRNNCTGFLCCDPGYSDYCCTSNDTDSCLTIAVPS